MAPKSKAVNLDLDTNNSEIRYRDVKKHPWGRYTAKVRDPKKNTRVWLGTFDTTDDTARAYDAVAREFHGAMAKTNFTYSGNIITMRSPSQSSTVQFYSPSHLSLDPTLATSTANHHPVLFDVFSDKSVHEAGGAQSDSDSSLSVVDFERRLFQNNIQKL